MQDGNGRTSLKTLVEFEASSHVSLSLSSDGRWLAYGDESSGSIFIGKWRNRSPYLSDVQKGPEIANLRILEWSPNSKCLLAASDAVAALLQPSKPSSASFFNGLEEIGIVHCFWSYDSAFVIANDSYSNSTAIFGIDVAVHWLPGVGMANDRPLLALRPDSKVLALWTFQVEGGECLMLYGCADWSLLLIIRSKCVLVSGISWSTNSKTLVVWDSVARNYMEFFHPDGSTKHIFTSADVTDEGVRTIALSPCSSLVAIFKENFNILVYNTLIWRHVSLIDIAEYSKGSVSCQWTPFVCWSFCGQYLALSSSASSKVVLWSKSLGDSFHFSFDEDSITNMTWHPKKPTLAVAMGSREVCLLKCPKFERKNPGMGIECCRLGFDRSVSVTELRWLGSNPSFLLIRSKSSYVSVACVR